MIIVSTAAISTSTSVTSISVATATSDTTLSLTDDILLIPIIGVTVFGFISAIVIILLIIYLVRVKRKNVTLKIGRLYAMIH